MRVNGEGACQLVEAAARIGAPLLHLSPGYVFDGKLDRPYREDDPTGPAGAYGRSRPVGEERVAELCSDSVILRTAWVYSPFGGNFVRTMLRLNETRDEVGLVADQLGNPTSALDIADALLVIAHANSRRFLCCSARRLPHDRLWRGDRGRLCRGHLWRSPRARPTPHPRPAHLVSRVPDFGALAGQFASRQRKATPPLRRGPAGLARIARGVGSVTKEVQ